MKEDQLISNYLREMVKKQNGNQSLKSSYWQTLGRKLNRNPTDVLERYSDSIQYNSRLSHGLPFVGTTPSPKIVKKRKREIEQEEEEEQQEISRNITPKRKIDFEHSPSPVIQNPNKKQKKTPRTILRSFQLNSSDNQVVNVTIEEQEEDNEELKITKKEISHSSKFLSLLSKETRIKDEAQLLHALFINSGDIENTIKFLKKKNFDENKIWSKKQDDNLRKKKNIKNLINLKGKKEVNNRIEFLNSMSDLI